MKRMSVIARSFAYDFELCEDLHRSALEYSPDSGHHTSTRLGQTLSCSVGRRDAIGERRRCGRKPSLNGDGAVDFLGGVRPTDVAAMISAKSYTPLAVRRAAFAGHWAPRTAGPWSQAG